MRLRRHVKPASLPSFPALKIGGIARDVGILALVFGIAFVAVFIYMSPGPIVSSEHTTPDVIGMSSDQAERELEQRGFKVKRAESRMHPIYDPGKVIWQDPPSGTVIPQSSIVSLTVSDGIAEYPVPDVSHMPLEMASRVIVAGGFRMGRIDTLPAPGPAGVVIDIRPSAGSLQSLGTPVQLVVSVPRPRLVPDAIIGPKPEAAP